MSETSACFTLAQGVELIEAVEKSGRIYMFAENYPYTAFNQEMARLYKAGEIGREGGNFSREFFTEPKAVLMQIDPV